MTNNWIVKDSLQPNDDRWTFVIWRKNYWITRYCYSLYNIVRVIIRQNTGGILSSHSMFSAYLAWIITNNECTYALRLKAAHKATTKEEHNFWYHSTNLLKVRKSRNDIFMPTFPLKDGRTNSALLLWNLRWTCFRSFLKTPKT